MIVSLAQKKILVAAEIAVREQAWVGGNGVLGLPMRLSGESRYLRHWDVTAVYDVLERALALQWDSQELVAWVRGDEAHHFAIRRPGSGSDDVISSESE